MRSPRKLPKSASVARPSTDGKLHAPAASRNGGAIIRALKPYAPHQGTALEIASGTGQHMLRLATTFPALTWQPTDIDPARLISIKAWCEEARLTNVKPPIRLDASVTGWAATHGGQSLIFLSNLLHLISDAEAATVISEAAKALAPDGVLVIYGPFLRGNAFASEGDQRFDTSLRAASPDIGYKSFEHIQRLQTKEGLAPRPPIDMPASNLLLVARQIPTPR